MQDLLNEKDFARKPYNPWPRFIVSYGIEIGAIVVHFLIMLLGNIKYNSTIAMAVIMFLPVIIAPIMILAKKRYVLITDNQAIIGMLILFSIYQIPLVLALLFDSFTTKIDPAGAFVNIFILVIYCISFITALIIFRGKKRKQKLRQQTH